MKEVLVKVTKIGRNQYTAIDENGKDWAKEVSPWQLPKAIKHNCPLKRTTDKNNTTRWEVMKEMSYGSKADTKAASVTYTNDTPAGNDVPLPTINEAHVETPKSHGELVDYIKDCYKLKPKGLVMSEVKWKFLVRTALRGKNLMMTGLSGCGKTISVKALVNAMNRPHFYFNLGATQDPRATLIGNTHLKNDGTVFIDSAFVKAIRTPNAIILLDEISRAHPDAWNILMTVLDENQRYLRLDEKETAETVKVADGVTFVATANIGNEYTSTRQMDRALTDRFVILEMEPLNKDEESGLLKHLYPDLEDKYVSAIAEIAEKTRKEFIDQSSRIQITNYVSTRSSIEMAGLIYDGFTFNEAAEVSIVPLFSDAGGTESERTYIRQTLQKYNFDPATESKKVSDKDGFFTVDEIRELSKQNS